MVFSLTLKLSMNCGAKFFNDKGSIHGYAELRGTLANFNLNQETLVMLKSSELYVRDV